MIDGLTVSELKGVIDRLPSPKQWVSEHRGRPPNFAVSFGRARVNNSSPKNPMGVDRYDYYFKVIRNEYGYDWELVSSNTPPK